MSVTFDATGSDYGLEIDVNMSNSNAALVCAALGIELDPDWCGGMDPQEFMGRVLLAIAISPTDEGMPSYDHVRAPGQARMIEGGRRPGYLQERLAQLRTLAQWAIDHGSAEVFWG